MFDGTARFVGGAISGSLFGNYNPTVVSKLATASPVALSASYKIRGDELILTADAVLDAALAGSHSVHFLICLDGYHAHPNFVMATLASEVFTPTAAGQSQTFSARTRSTRRGTAAC